MTGGEQSKGVRVVHRTIERRQYVQFCRTKLRVPWAFVFTLNRAIGSLNRFAAKRHQPVDPAGRASGPGSAPLALQPLASRGPPCRPEFGIVRTRLIDARFRQPRRQYHGAHRLAFAQHGEEAVML